MDVLPHLYPGLQWQAFRSRLELSLVTQAGLRETAAALPLPAEQQGKVTLAILEAQLAVAKLGVLCPGFYTPEKEEIRCARR